MAARKTISIKPMKIESATVVIEGMTPLLMHRFSEKAKRVMRENKAGKKTKEREPCDPEQEAADACYRIEDDRFGFPLTAFKEAIRGAAHVSIGVPKTLIGKSLFFHADGQMDGVPLVVVNTPGYKVREDPARVQSGSMDLRYRPEFENWTVSLRIQYDVDLMTLDTIVNMIDRAGFGVGVGDWRPEKGGDFGRFCVRRGE